MFSLNCICLLVLKGNNSTFTQCLYKCIIEKNQQEQGKQIHRNIRFLTEI